MKLLQPFVIILLLCGTAAGIDFPLPTNDARPGDLVTKAIRLDGVAATAGTLTVPESWENPSKLIHLPVAIIHSTSREPREPIFVLHGGPGLSNMKTEHEYGWALEHHDVVLVGYRGIDGSASLAMPEFKEWLETVSDPLNTESLKEGARILDTAVDRLEQDGITISEYSLDAVAADIEAARRAMGHEKINVSGGSYGGAVACYYCLSYPQSVHRCAMIEAAFPWNIGVAEPKDVDARLQTLNDHWKRDPDKLAYSKDIVQTIRKVLSTLPREQDGVVIDKGTMRLMTYFSLYTKQQTDMTLAAFAAAEKGDYGPLAQIDQFWGPVVDMFNWGDLIIKTRCSRSGKPRNYVVEMDPPESIIGSPLTQLGWGIFQFSSYAPRQLRYPAIREVRVETLLVYGSEEAAIGPRKNMRHFPEGRLKVLDNLGHMDVAEEAGRLQQAFFDRR